jgi:hypothetical protein
MRIPEVLLSISISVMFNGFGRLFQGALAKGQGKLFRLVSLGLGALSVGGQRSSSVTRTSLELFFLFASC